MVATAPRPIALAWSGGKDSTMALAALRADPAWRVVALVTSVTREYDRVAIHGVRRTLLEAQARALGLPLVIAWLRAGIDNAGYESAWGTALDEVARTHGPVQDIAFGDLFLTDVRAYRERQCAAHGWTPHFPLWGVPTGALAAQVLAAGVEAYLTCVDTTQLDARCAGRRYDAALLAELPPHVDPCGERGEFHSCVVDGPGFAAPIAVTVGERVRRDDRFEYADLLPVD
jgi:uncharacterized protein (TIGR00290 family)